MSMHIVLRFFFFRFFFYLHAHVKCLTCKLFSNKAFSKFKDRRALALFLSSLLIFFSLLYLMVQEPLKKEIKDAAINVATASNDELALQGQAASKALPTTTAASSPLSMKAYLADIIGDKYVLKLNLYTKILKTNSFSLIVHISMQALG